MARRQVLQVEQLFDDGSNPTIADTLFTVEAGPSGPVPLTERSCVCCGGPVVGNVLRCGPCIAANYEALELIP